MEFVPAEIEDLPAIVRLLRDDPLGKEREVPDLAPYASAFREITEDDNQILLVGRVGAEVVATLQISFIPNLTFGGMRRAQIEGVRVAETHRGLGIGREMIQWAIQRAVDAGCGVVQLTTDRAREHSRDFYESLGFIESHRGMKLWLLPPHGRT